jgi:hypothetical protein
MSEWSPEHHSTSTKSWRHPVCGIHAARSTNQVKVLALGCTPRVSSAVIAMTFVLQRFLWIVVNRLHASNSWQSRDLRAISSRINTPTTMPDTGRCFCLAGLLRSGYCTREGR